ncbi:tRNA pseudouridine(38-40) synthase TruA [Nitrincola sp.]|uniref:tRNA pseudouridine(38-40) synthase TruA n=1 Tax=Nitrincola sp. TaxID=1926584 RepID=UPI003A95413C
MLENPPLSGATDVAPYRYVAAVEYSGAAYHGWQKQPHDPVPCIQGKVESALSRVANHPVDVICAGRTDAGVSACYQVIHFDTQVQRPERAWVMGGNTYLPEDIALLWVKPVSSDFHARFSAQARRYRYIIYSAAIKPGVLAKGITWTWKSLDEVKMQQAAEALVGEHDFTSYRAVACQAKNPVRQVQHLKVYRQGQLLIIDIKANAFLHHMVRNIAGVLMKIGAGEAPVGWAQDVLDARDRRQGGVTASPFGLYFVDVDYPAEFLLPQAEPGPFFLSSAD